MPNSARQNACGKRLIAYIFLAFWNKYKKMGKTTGS